MTLDQFIQNMKDSTQHKCFYHFTDTRNLTSIRKHGLLSTRMMKTSKIPIPAPGGNDWSMEADIKSGMDGYVHLCFMTNNAMEFLARQDGRIQDVFYLNIRPDVIKLPGAMLTLDVANKSGVEALPVSSMVQKLDLEVIYKRTDWKAPEIKERLKAADKCELLIPNHLPLEYITN